MMENAIVMKSYKEGREKMIWDMMLRAGQVAIVITALMFGSYLQ
jgi:hypothetical protein